LPVQTNELILAQKQHAASLGRARIMENRQRRRERWRTEARVLWEQWRNEPFFVLGVALYWR